MSFLSKKLKNQISKYNDLQAVITKLEDNGALVQINQYFNDLFESEKKFVINELDKVYNGNFDFDKQVKLNCGIFKSNFELILQLIVKDVWTNLFETKQHVERQSQANQAQQIIQQPNERSTSNIQNQQALFDQQLVGKQNAYLNVNVNRSQIHERDQGYAKPIEQQQQLQQIQQSQQQQAPLQMQSSQHSTGSRFRSTSKSQRNQPDQLQQGSLRKGSSEGKMRQSSHSDFMNKSHANCSHHNLMQQQEQQSHLHNLDSEFSYISKSPSRFSREDRHLAYDKGKSSAPGPLSYQTGYADNYQHGSKCMTKFGTSPKKCWIDESVKVTQNIPAPGAYFPTKHFLSTKIGINKV